jgi:RimJ/RimL family protein N-acetyltransferase
LQILRSELIEIAPLGSTSITSEYLQTLNDHSYMQFSRHSTTVSTRESQIEYISGFNSFDCWILGVKHLKSRTLVGTTNLYFDFSNRTISIGFLIFKEHSGKGLAKATLNLLCTYLTNTFPRFRILIGTNKSNVQMRKVVESFSFQVQVELPEANVETITYFKEIPALTESSYAEIPSFVRWASNISVAANDAGGAEQIAWLMRKMNRNIKAYLMGPAISVFERSGINYEPISTLSDLVKSDLVITGSGWMSTLENDVIRYCQSNNIACLTVLDHWVNFKERFLKEPVAIPNMFAVTNLPALMLANKVFSDKPVWLLPDFQIDFCKSLIDQGSSRCKILVLMEPSPTLSSDFCITSDMEEELIENATQIRKFKGLMSVVLRPHPSQALDSERLSKLKDKFPEVLVSKNKDLMDDLRDSAVVLGFSTYGLYISAMCGVDTRSYFAGSVNHWTSQFKTTITSLDRP